VSGCERSVVRSALTAASITDPALKLPNDSADEFAELRPKVRGRVVWRT
jgi:hypothetical protein